MNVLCDRLRKTDEHIAEVALLLRAIAATDAAGRKTEPIQLSQGDLGKLVGAARGTARSPAALMVSAALSCVDCGLLYRGPALPQGRDRAPDLPYCSPCTEGRGPSLRG